MNFSDLKKLIRLFENSKISELEVEQEGLRVQIKKGSQPPTTIEVHPEQPHVPAEAVTEAQTSHSSRTPVPEGEIGAGGHLIKAPMVGTFFRAPSPTSPPYIEEGDIVRKGQTLCIIEAMKLMNEIESDIDGRVARIFTLNGKPVEYDEPLIEIEPS